MKTLFETVSVAFSMFSALPAPQAAWGERNMRYALCAFPLVGAAVGLSWAAWAAVCRAAALPALLRGAGLCLLPVAVTGGIHLDGYADTCDALASCAPPEKRREILRDTHCGAFAIIRLCAYFIGSFALCCALRPDGRALLCGGLSFVLSRSLSGFAIAAFPLARDTGLAHAFASAAAKGRVRAALGVLSALLACALAAAGGWTGVAMAAAGAAVFLGYLRTAREKFQGISGDLAGWFLQRAELWMLAALVACQYGGIGR